MPLGNRHPRGGCILTGTNPWGSWGSGRTGSNGIGGRTGSVAGACTGSSGAGACAGSSGTGTFAGMGCTGSAGRPTINRNRSTWTDNVRACRIEGKGPTRTIVTRDPCISLICQGPVQALNSFGDTPTGGTECSHTKSPTRSLDSTPRWAWLAQSVEHETLNLRVVGSSPTLGAKCCQG